MDPRPTFDQLIAAKLVNIPAPAMADAIWTRIEAQLDIDMPTDDGGSGPSSSPPSGPGVIGWGLSVVIVALISVFFIFKNKPKTKLSTQSPVAPTHQIYQPAQQATGPPKNDNTVNKNTSPVNPGASVPRVDAQFDSTQSPILTTQPFTTRDSIKAADISPVILPPIKDTVPLQKKRRGVSGLNESDYRIVPKKDST